MRHVRSYNRTMMEMHGALLAGVSLAMLLPLSPALAQTAAGQAGTAAAGSGNQVEEIVVTAQKRSERLQDVPIAVTALGAEALANAGVQGAADLAQTVPGLQYNTQIGGYGQPRIRGVGTAATGPGVENPVATYIDGVYYGAASGALFSMSDVSQVAVLKGPQGTLFGRNATGGLIQVTTKEPSQEFAADIEGTIGSKETVGTNVFVTGGLTDQIAGSAAFYLDNQNAGFGTNLATGEDVQTHRSYATRDKLLFEPDAETKFTLAVDYSQTHGTDPAIRTIGQVPFSPTTTPGGPWDIDLDTQPNIDTRQYGVSLTGQHDFDGVQALSITAYRNSALSAVFDGDQTPFDVVRVFINQRDEQVSQEFQLLSTDKGPFKWVVGLYYYSASDAYDPVKTALNLPTGKAATFLEADDELTSYAGFGQASYQFDEATQLTAGLRYTADQRSLIGSSTFVNAFGAFPTDTTGSKDFYKLTWRYALDHHFTEDLLGYVSINRGFKSGSYDPQAIPAVVLKPETLDAYEVGLKSDLFDHKVRFNVAGFYYDYTNVQVTQIVNNIEAVYNGSGATSYGLDFDLTAKPTSQLTLDGGLSLIHARYGNFPNAFESTPSPAGGNIVTLTGNATGKQLQVTPDYTFNLGGVYAIPSSIGEFDAAANYYFSGGWYSEPENRLRQPSYGVLDASVKWTSPDERYDVRLWGRNLTDQVYALQTNSVDSGDNRNAAPGRTFGLTAGLHF